MSLSWRAFRKRFLFLCYSFSCLSYCRTEPMVLVETLCSTFSSCCFSGSERVSKAAQGAVPSHRHHAPHRRPRRREDHLPVSGPTGNQARSLRTWIQLLTFPQVWLCPPSHRRWLVVVWKPASGFRSCAPCWTVKEAAKTRRPRPRAGTHSACRRRCRWPMSLHD